MKDDRENRPAEQRPAGRVITVQGSIVDVQFPEGEEGPDVYGVLETRAEDGRTVILEVAEHLADHVVRCIALGSTLNLPYQTPAFIRGSAVMIPVGDELFGRIINVVGQPIDQKGPITASATVPIRQPGRSMRINPDRVGATEGAVLETGIKIIDLLFPVVKGSKNGILGGAALGKSILMLELMHNVIEYQSSACVFTGAGERIREGNELYFEFIKQKLLDKVMLAFGQMDESPGARFEIAFTGAALARHLQQQGKDVLFFIDNVFRFLQAGAEISTLLGRTPSESGYQPTLASEVGEFHERISGPDAGGSITALETVYVPADDLTDPAVVTLFSYLDSLIVLSRERVQMGLYPAVDPLLSSCSNLDPAVVGKHHFAVAQEVQKLFAKQEELKRVVMVIGTEELSQSDRILYERARRLQNFLTQPFFTADIYSGRKGEYVPIKETLIGCEKIIAGRLDTVPAERFYMIGKIGPIQK